MRLGLAVRPRCLEPLKSYLGPSEQIKKKAHVPCQSGAGGRKGLLASLGLENCFNHNNNYPAALKWGARAREEGRQRRPVSPGGPSERAAGFTTALPPNSLQPVCVPRGLLAESLGQVSLCLTFIYVSISCEQTLVWPDLGGK